ncbi:type IV pilus biogenesis protein PilP [Erwinia amylovora]|uniref:type IV pilus biogenesis protein PilP n=2 Tax=Erwinia amylovora TaxID=552 RepID=UPI000C074AAD|nr:type IV pilus biogenesis protein PilP [Erwinia amylovora]
MQRNKWRYLLLPALLSGQMAVAGPSTPDGLSPQGGASNEAPPSGHATAATVVVNDTSGRDNSMGRLEDIQAKTLLYEAQLAQAKAFNELQKNGYDAVLGGPFNPQPAAPVKDNADAKPAQESKTPPLIVEISGGKQLSATLRLDGANEVRVQAGSRIPGTGWTVTKITFSEVTVSSADGGLVSLAFAG